MTKHGFYILSITVLLLSCRFDDGVVLCLSDACVCGVAAV